MWKPKEYFSADNHGNCPVCGLVIKISDFLADDTPLVIKNWDEPIDVSEPNFHCEGCGTDLVVDLALKFTVNSQVWKKRDLTAD